jgi:hypothetical protein
MQMAVSSTVKTVLRGHLWDKEKVAFQLWKGPYGMVLCYPKQKAPA